MSKNKYFVGKYHITYNSYTKTYDVHDTLNDIYYSRIKGKKPKSEFDVVSDLDKRDGWIR